MGWADRANVVPFEESYQRKLARQIRDAAHLEEIIRGIEPLEQRETLEKLRQFVVFPLCANSECRSGEDAIWNAVVLLRRYDLANQPIACGRVWPRRDPDGGGPTIRVRVCSTCRGMLTIDHVMSDAIWKRIATKLQQQEGANPVRALTTLIFEQADGDDEVLELEYEDE